MEKISDLTVLKAYFILSHYCEQKECLDCVINRAGLSGCVCAGDETPDRWPCGRKHTAKWPFK